MASRLLPLAGIGGQLGAFFKLDRTDAAGVQVEGEAAGSVLCVEPEDVQKFVGDVD